MFPMYDPVAIQPMRDEVTSAGLHELHTPEDVDEAMKLEGTSLVFVNSVCGCAAGSARPGLRLALKEGPRPDHLYSVFAGQDREATARAREYFLGFPPSSPSFAILRNGRIIHMIERHHIEGRSPQMIAQTLRDAFERHCAPAAS